MLRDILSGKDPQVRAVTEVIIAAEAELLLLQGFDYDLELRALQALADALAARGVSYPHLLALPPNAGRPSGADLDGDGRLGGPGDAQGYGRFFGQGAMALLSRHPIDRAGVIDFSDLLWRDLLGADLPQQNGRPFPSAAAQAVQRLSSHGHWVVPILHPELGRVHLLAFHATPPVFDGPEDRNGRRNHDEAAFWLHYLEGGFGAPPAARFVLLGQSNLDPQTGEGRRGAIAALLRHPALQDPLGGSPTVTWPSTGPRRASVLLPSSDWRVTAAGISPAAPKASRHRLIWAELRQ